MTGIPKVFHISWKTKDVVDSEAPMIQRGLRRLIELHPDWDVQISEDQDLDDYLSANLEPRLWDLVKDEGPVQKTDVWRLLKLFYEGGVYVDLDRWCNKSLNDILTDDVKCVLATNGDCDFSHDLMITAPHNPLFGNVLDLYFQRRVDGDTNTYLLGAQTYMHGISFGLIGKMVNTDPGVGLFDQLRAKIEQLPGFVTYREELPNNTLLFEGDASDWEDVKRAFYAESGLKHWTGEW
jgi:hypothetical protein